MTSVLVCSDSSLAESGFSQLSRRILTALHNSPEFNVAEFAFSGQVEQKGMVPWKFYPVAVNGNDPRFKDFMSKQENRHGAWRFESTVLHFKPDVVFSINDPWQVSYQATSPLKPYFHWSLCPTVDSDPQKADFLQLFAQADSLFTYTEYGKKVLESQGLKVREAIPMGIDFKIFHPVLDKKIHKKQKGLSPDSIIFGFVARNQMRKKLCELMDAFNIYLRKVPKEIADRSYLYLHTTFPDQSVDIPQVLMQNGLYNKVYFSYMCQKTEQWFPSIFQDSVTWSPFSSSKSAALPNVMKGVKSEQLAEVYNCFDYYIQWSSNEGFGAPIVEAAACGLHTITPNCTAMGEVCPNVGGTVIDPLDMPYDTSVGARRAVMNNEALAEKMVELAINGANPPEYYVKKVLEKYDWGIITQKWLNHFRELDLKHTWNSPPKYIHLPEEFPENVSVSNFVLRLYHEIPYKWMFNTLNIMRYLNYGFQVNQGQVSPVTPETILNAARKLEKAWNDCEKIRTGQLRLLEEDFLQ